MTAEFKKILIMKPSSLGDIIMTLPALSALRRNYPGSKISWLVRPEFSELLENHPQLDKVIYFDRKYLGRSWYDPKAFGALVSLIKRLRSEKYDAIFDFQGLFRTAAMAYLSGCRRRYGSSNAREISTVFYTNKTKDDLRYIHAVESYMKVVELAGVKDTKIEFVLDIDKETETAAVKLLEEWNVNRGKYAVLIAGSAREDKRWPSERFAEIANRLSKDYGLSIAATGSKGEFETVEAIKVKAKVPIANLAGKTNLKELASILKNAMIVISNDTGPGHLASIFGRPLVMLFGRSNPAKVGPYGRKNCVVAIEPEGRNAETSNYDDRYDIKNITVESVYRKVVEQLTKN